MVVLLSGGLDSCVLLASVAQHDPLCHALSFDYGQRHAIELEHAKRIAAIYHVPHTILPIKELFSHAPSSLVDCSLPVETTKVSRPTTYVPCRNLIFLSLAASYAESHQLSTIYIGSTAEDQEAYPDCRPEFFDMLTHTIQQGSRSAITIAAPFVTYTKRDIVQLGRSINAPIALSWSCYNPVNNNPCTICQACRLRHLAEQ